MANRWTVDSFSRWARSGVFLELLDWGRLRMYLTRRRFPLALSATVGLGIDRYVTRSSPVPICSTRTAI
ncbi:hypothetical protein A5638_03010 [Mycolicibacterium fortuitum]|nr:hypothetical protein A5638_03010 [Mycolicibacterium fortuitum]